MIAFYLDYLLDPAECEEVQQAVGEPIEVVRVPWLFPLKSTGEIQGIIAPDRVRPHLERAGIARAAGQRVLLVAPREVHWYASLAECIQQETGHYPLLVQPEERREDVGCSGPLRILDMEAYLRDTDTGSMPPWLC